MENFPSFDILRITQFWQLYRYEMDITRFFGKMVKYEFDIGIMFSKFTLQLQLMPFVDCTMANTQNIHLTKIVSSVPESNFWRCSKNLGLANGRCKLLR